MINLDNNQYKNNVFNNFKSILLSYLIYLKLISININIKSESLFDHFWVPKTTFSKYGTILAYFPAVSLFGFMDHTRASTLKMTGRQFLTRS